MNNRGNGDGGVGGPGDEDDHPFFGWPAPMDPEQQQQQTQLSTIVIIAGAVSMFLSMYGLATTFDNNFPPALKVKDAYLHKGSFIAESALFSLEILSSYGPKVVGTRQNEVLAVEFIKARIENIISEAKAKNYVTNGIMYDVQKATGCFDNSGIYCYQNITNVVVMVGGYENSESILVNCHFDSVPYSTGTSDDNLNCVVMLEIIGILVAKPNPLLRNVVFLFNGAEEVGLMGSHAFISQHKWSKQIVAFINLDSAGAGGREILFQSSSGHHYLVEAYSESVSYPSGNVFAEELYETGLIPSTTDYAIFHDFGGLPGLDIAHYKNGFVYHTKYDTINRVKVNEIQHTGNNILELVKKMVDVKAIDFAKYKKKTSADNKDSSKNAVFYDVLGLFMMYVPEDQAKQINFMLGLSSLLCITTPVHPGRSWMLLKNTAIMLGGYILVMLVTATTAILLNVFDGTMSWYGNEAMVFPLYVVPAVLSLALPVALSHHFVTEQDDPTMLRRDRYVLSFIKAAQLIWTLMLLVSTYYDIRSSYIFLVMLLPITVIGCLASIIDRYVRLDTRKLIVVNLFGCSLSALYVIYLGIELTNFIIPLMGRIGDRLNPDFIVGPLVAVLTILVIGYFISLILYTDDIWNNVLWVLALIIGLTIATGINAIVNVPYTGNHYNPRPQRFYIVHLNRNFPPADLTFYNVPTSGFVIYPMDYRTKITLDEYIGGKYNIKTLHKDCTNSKLLCSVPLIYARKQTLLQRSYWVDAPMAEVDKRTKQLVYKDFSYTNRFSDLDNGPLFHFNFTVGSKWLEVFLYLEEGIEATNIIIGDTVENINPLWKEDNMYHIRYARGLTTDDTWIFSLTFHISDLITYRRVFYENARMFRLFVCTHYIDQIRTQEYAEFLKQFPPWAHISSFITDCNTSYH